MEVLLRFWEAKNWTETRWRADGCSRHVPPGRWSYSVHKTHYHLHFNFKLNFIKLLYPDPSAETNCFVSLSLTLYLAKLKVIVMTISKIYLSNLKAPSCEEFVFTVCFDSERLRAYWCWHGVTGHEGTTFPEGFFILFKKIAYFTKTTFYFPNSDTVSTCSQTWYKESSHHIGLTLSRIYWGKECTSLVFLMLLEETATSNCAKHWSVFDSRRSVRA